MPTPFQERVYSICRCIPKGRVATYADIASAIKSKGYRAVGNALNKNPYWPDVPCHRVVGKNGRLTGFARGIDAKRTLLEKEGIIIEGDRVLQDFLMARDELLTKVRKGQAGQYENHTYTIRDKRSFSKGEAGRKF